MTKEINELTQDRIADAVLSAMKREELMNKEVAEIINISPVDMSNLKRHTEKVTQPVWTKLRNWMISGLPLREYKPKAPADFIPALQEGVSATSNVNMPPVVEKPAEATEKDETAERVRMVYEMAQPKKKGEDVIIARRDPQEIDPKTGELLASITIDTYRDYFTITVKR